MSIYEIIGAIVFGLMILVFFIPETIKKIKMVKEISPGLRDNKISATVVAHIPCLRGDIKPVLEYEVNGVRGKYIFQFETRPRQYPKGGKKFLRYSAKSGLAYDRKDLIKMFIENLIAICFGLIVFLVPWLCLFL